MTNSIFSNIDIDNSDIGISNKIELKYLIDSIVEYLEVDKNIVGITTSENTIYVLNDRYISIDSIDTDGINISINDKRELINIWTLLVYLATVLNYNVKHIIYENPYIDSLYRYLFINNLGSDEIPFNQLYFPNITLIQNGKSQEVKKYWVRSIYIHSINEFVSFIRRIFNKYNWLETISIDIRKLYIKGEHVKDSGKFKSRLHDIFWEDPPFFITQYSDNDITFHRCFD